MTRLSRLPTSVALSASGLAVGVLAWWVVVVAFAIPPYLLPSPGAVVARLLSSPGLYAQSAGETLLKTLVGGGLGIAAGFVFGILVAHVRLFRRMVLPYLIALRVVPKVALAPVFLLYVGLGFRTAVGFVALLTVFPMTISTPAGFDRVPDRQRDLLRSVDASNARILLAVELPYALPDVLAGLKQSVVLAIVGAVVAEWLLAPSGLGYLVLVGTESLQMAVVLAAVVVLGCLSVALYGVVTLIQRRLSWT